MKKILFLLLVTISSYAQTYQNPTFGTVTTKTAPTVTSVNYLATVETTGVIAKIDPVNLPFTPKLRWGYVVATNGGARTIGVNEDALDVYGSPIANYTINLPTVTEARTITIAFDVDIANLTIGASGAIDYYPPKAKAYDTWSFTYEPTNNRWITKDYFTGDLGAQISSLPNKSTLGDTDLFAISDGSNSGLPKRVSALNLYNNYLKPKNDLLYDKLGVNAVSTAYVESNGTDATAQIGNNRKAFLTIDAALDALPASGGVVKIGIGSFNSPTPSKIKSNTSFIGSKEPAINSTVTISAPNTRPTITAPTALINGTILTGEFSALDKTNITVEKLGIDVGKTWIDTFNGGVTVGGLVIASTTTTSPIKNIKVNNVTVLGYSPTTAQHCMLFENVVNSTFTNLTTYYHVHGVAIKGLSLLIDGINSYSHNNDGLIIKSDIYAPTRDVEISNVNITSLSGYESGGIILEEGVNGSSLLERVSLNNISLKYVRYGLNNVNKVSNINISNFNLYDSNTFGINLSGGDVDKINLTGINIVKTTTEGIKISLSGSQTVNIVNANVSDATTTGFELTAVASGTINIVNSNTLNTTASYLITGNVYGSSNFGTGTLTGYIKFYNPFVKSNGRIFSTDDSSFGDLASTNGTLDFNFSNSAQKGTIESYNFTTAQAKPLEIKSSALLLSALAGGGGIVLTDAIGNLSIGTAPTSGTYTPTLTNLVNCSALTISSATYTRIGNIVTVMFSAEGSVTTASTTTSFEIDLPINRANATQIICGMSSITSQTNANVYGGYSAISAVSKAKLVAFSPASTGGSHKFYMSFQYSVLQ